MLVAISSIPLQLLWVESN